MLESEKVHLGMECIRITTGPIIDATIIHAPFFDRQEHGRTLSGDAPDQEGKYWYSV